MDNIELRIIVMGLSLLDRIQFHFIYQSIFGTLHPRSVKATFFFEPVIIVFLHVEMVASEEAEMAMIIVRWWHQQGALLKLKLTIEVHCAFHHIAPYNAKLHIAIIFQDER